MADFESIIKKHINGDGNIPADAIVKLTKAISTAVGNEFVEKTRYNAKLEEIDALKTEKQTAEDNATTAEKWKDKYDKARKEFDDYKAGIAAKESKSAKEKAVSDYYKSKGITGKNLDIAMKGSGAEIDALELDDGKIKDTKTLDDLIGGTFSALVVTTTTQGANVPNPPAKSGGEPKFEGRAKELAASYFKNQYGEVKE